MHNLRREQLRGGMPLREMLVLRKDVGTFSGDPDVYAASCLREATEGRTVSRTVKFDDGRMIALAQRPLRGGGWVMTHTDVTEQARRRKGARFAASREEASRRIDADIASFRSRVESLLQVVAQSAAAMKRRRTACWRRRIIRCTAPRARSADRTKRRPMSKPRPRPPKSCRLRSRRSADGSRTPNR